MLREVVHTRRRCGVSANTYESAGGYVRLAELTDRSCLSGFNPVCGRSSDPGIRLWRALEGGTNLVLFHAVRRLAPYAHNPTPPSSSVRARSEREIVLPCYGIPVPSCGTFGFPEQ